MISILLPIYNGIEFIDDSVNSIIGQEYKHWELLIGINGHKPNSEVYQIAKKYEKKCDYGKIRVYDFFHIKSKCETLNILTHYAKYNWVALIDVDDMWHSYKLFRQMREINNNNVNKYDVIGTKAVYFGLMEGVTPDIPTGNITNLDFVSLSNPIINSSVIIKKELCFWNKNFNDGLEDFELWLRLKKQGKTFYNCEEVLVRHRIHPDSAFNSKNLEHKMEELLAYINN
jgi:glycosyltransferase involved in cell wall biosynthesis